MVTGGSGSALGGPRTSLNVLGPLLVATHDDVGQRPGARRQRRILTILAVAAVNRRVVGVDELLVAVYGDDAPPSTRRALFTEIWRCRQLLGAPESIIGDQDGYLLDESLVDVDAVRFVRLLQEGRDALQAGAFEVAEAALSSAADLWRDEPIPDWQEHPGALAFIARFAELRLGGTEDRAEAMAGSGRHRDAAALLQEITREHPVREHAWALLIESLVALGDHRRARGALDTARRTLAEYGVDLGVELRAARNSLTGSGHDSSRLAAPVAEDGALIGRSAERAVAVGVATEALREATPRSILVSGEAGIGKSAFVDSVAHTLRQAGHTIESVNCDRRLNLPFAVLRPLLDRQRQHIDPSLPDVDQVLAETTRHAAVIEALAGLIESAALHAGGLVMIVEDLQWATADVLDVLVALLARQSQVPIALLLTLRDPGEVGLEVRAELKELRQRSEATIALAGLTIRQAQQLLGDVDEETAGAAHRLTGGNPLYLRSLAGSGFRLGGPRPSSLVEALDEHIDSLPMDILGVLELAATIGTVFDMRTLVAAATQLSAPVDAPIVAQALSVATALGILRPVVDGATRREFVHALIRDRLCERSPAPERVLAHAAIYRALMRVAVADRPSPDLVAHHSFFGWPQCPTAMAVRALEEAGDEASRQLAFAEAQRYYRQALDLIVMDVDYGDVAAIGALLSAAGQAAVADADLAAARASYLALRDHGERSGHVDSMLRGSIGLLQTYANERVDEYVLDEMTAAVAATLSGGWNRESTPVLIAECLAMLTTYRPAEARVLTPRVIAAEPEHEILLLQRVWEQEETSEQVAIASRLDELGADTPAAALRRWAADVAGGQRVLDSAPPGWSLGVGTEMERWESHLWQTTVAIATGDFARADRLLNVGETMAPRAPSPLERAAREAAIIGQRTWLAYLRSDLDTLAALFAANLANWTVSRPIQRVLGAFSAPLLLPPAEAWRLVDEIVDEFAEGVVPGRHQLAPVVALSSGCIGVGHQRGIALCRELLRPHPGEHGLFYFAQYWGCTDYHLARLAAAVGDLDESIELFERALEIYCEVGARCFEAFTLRASATVRYFRNEGEDRSVAAPLAEQARQLGESLGMMDLAGAPWPPSAVLDALRHDSVEPH